MFLESQARRLYRVLQHGGHYTQLHCQDMKTGQAVSRELVYGETKVIEWARRFNGKGNCFLGRNPRQASGVVGAITAVTLDLDPANYDKAVGASKEQTEGCLNAAREILRVYPNGYLALSGNGCLVIWAGGGVMDRNEIEGIKRGTARFQDDCRRLITGFKEVRLDATHDSERLIKLIGTVSVKGEVRPTRFTDLRDNGRDGNKLFDLLAKLGAEKPVDKGALLDKSNYPSRSEADYALVSHYKQSGLGPDAALEALKCHALGRPDRIDDHKRLVDKLYSGYRPSTLVLHSPSTSLEDYMTKLAERSTYVTPELPIGIQALDKATWGLKRGEIYTVAAHTGVGKTSFCINVAARLCSLGKSVLYLSTELSYQHIWDRFFCYHTGIPGEQFTKGTFEASERAKLDAYLSVYKGNKFYVNDSFTPELRLVETAIKEIHPDVLVFDHIQHVPGGTDKRLSVSEFVQGLKRLSMEHNTAVLMVSQFSRPQRSTDFQTGAQRIAKPTIFDFKESGTIEQESAFCLLMYGEGASLDTDVPIITADLVKNRYGPKVVTDLAFYSKTFTFKPVEV